ncbi:hypothetical protein [Kitasatospora aureofaciens]|uniref:hypothetical protein n=1 Tax=Kitasatospora aureofaciens TaxID=1894 RepID=UPI0005255DB4|nr:hypothetical protein [Kitasatospora aureofaciens]
MTRLAFDPVAARLPGADRARRVTYECGLPVALLASADTRWLSADTVDVAGPAYTICRYEDSRTEVHRLPAATRSESRRTHFVQAVLAASVPDGKPAGDHSSLFVRGRLQDATVRADGRQRAFATIVDGRWLVLAVVPDRVGKGTAPNLRLIVAGPTAAEVA